MAYIQPNSIVQLFKGINLDNRYMHTIYFASVSAQNTWFASKATNALSFQQVSYVRYTKNQIKLKCDATSVMDCTYLRFQNNRTVDMWYYAFINNVDYINENTALITYEIDVMQTWFIQKGSVRPCMIRREHSSTDALFENLESEPIGNENYENDFITDCNTLGATNPPETSTAFSKYSVVINTTGEPSTGLYSSGLFNGTKYQAVHCDSLNDAQDVKSALGTIIGSWDAGEQTQDVINLQTFPSYFVDATYSEQVREGTKIVNGSNLLGGYNPKNKKLFTYPYNYLYCTTHNGSGQIYRWEYFSNGSETAFITNKTFKVMGSFIGGGQIKCYPMNYEGVTNNYEMGVSMDDFPKNAFVYDAYQAWIAAGGKTRLENEQKILFAKQAVEVVSVATGAAAQTAASGVDAYEAYQTGDISKGATAINNAIQANLNIAKTLIEQKEARYKIDYQWKDAKYRPNVLVGTSEPNLMVGARKLNFYFYNVHVKKSELARIDDFFSCYGYAVNKVKAPNLTGRQYWNFIQTDNAVIAGDMPASSKEAIGRIFDGGITFWHNGDNVGNYAISTTGGAINNPIVS